MNGLLPSGTRWRAGLYGLFAITVLNYLAQIPCQKNRAEGLCL